MVTTTRLTHATPSAAYAHTVDRYWEGDSDIPADVSGHCTDIAYQLAMNSSHITVIVTKQFLKRREHIWENTVIQNFMQI